MREKENGIRPSRILQVCAAANGRESSIGNIFTDLIAKGLFP